MYRVMIADDEDIIVTGLSKLLPWQKYNCEIAAVAGDGETALKLVRRCKPHILFTDIRMPGIDGLSLIAALRSEFSDMEISILSGYPDFEYAQRAIRLGVTSYILKPSKMAELEEALKNMVARLEKKNILPQLQTEQPACENAEVDAEGEGAGNFIINNAMRYMEEHYAEKLALPDVANHVYVSQWHLSKLISRTTGQSFSDLLNGIRIKQAKKLLEDPALKIWEVSEKVGFSDVTHFSRMFKKLENKSANEYRNQLVGHL